MKNFLASYFAKNKYRAHSYPDFLIVGAHKAGTSACAHNLREHPDIYTVMKEDKLRFLGYEKFHFDGDYFTHEEVNYFSEKILYDRGLSWYEQLFNETKCRIAGEKSPEYLYNHKNIDEFSNKICDRIKSSLPDVKIIILLRDPVNRAFSHWNHTQDQPLETSIKYYKPFHSCLLDFMRSTNKSSVHEHKLFTYGDYYRNVCEYLSIFGKENVYIGIQERIKQNKQTEYEKILKFLGAKLKKNIKYGTYHQREYKDRQLDEQSIEILRDYYREGVTQLKELLNDDLPEWREY